MEQNLSQYRIFHAVARAGNISKAAKELYISQPAISKSVSRLEESLGTTLFTRSSRGVHLTEEGKILFEHTSAAFDALSQGELELRRIREFHMGQLRLGGSCLLWKVSGSSTSSSSWLHHLASTHSSTNREGRRDSRKASPKTILSGIISIVRY